MVSYKQSWGTHMEHSPEYVQSVGQKELFKYFMCWCRWIHNKVQELYEMWNMLLRFLNTFLAMFGMSSNEHIGYVQSVAEKELFRNSMCSLLDIPNNAKKVFKNLNNMFHIS